jgi:hypothetical protein
MYDGKQHLRRRVGPLALVAALVATLAPGSALAAPRNAGDYPMEYMTVKMQKTLVTSRSTSNSSVGDFTVVKRFDRASAVIMDLGTKGQHFEQATP